MTAEQQRIAIAEACGAFRKCWSINNLQPLEAKAKSHVARLKSNK